MVYKSILTVWYISLYWYMVVCLGGGESYFTSLGLKTVSCKLAFLSYAGTFKKCSYYNQQLLELAQF